MNLVKRITVVLTILTSSVYAQYDYLDEYENNNQEFLELLAEDSDDKLDFINEMMPPSFALRAIPPQVIVDLLLELGALEILQQDFFLSTNRPARRSLLDMPLFQPNKAVFPIPSFFNTQLFFDFTPKARFTRTSSNINSYIATSDPSLLAALDNTIKALIVLSNGSIVNLNIPLILDLIGQMTLVERNIGFMFQTGGRWDRLQLRIMFPLYYHERNFFLSQADLDTLALELGFTDPTLFDDSFAVSDRLGLGDTRIEFGMHAIEKQWCDMVLSLYATIPTAFSLAKGLAGHTFKAPGTYPEVDFEVLYAAAEAALAGNETLAEQEASFKVIQTLLLDAFKRVDAALLDNGLGNESHVGLGACMAIDARLDQWICQPWASCTYWHNRVAFEYLFKNDTTRFYVNKNDPASFDRDWENEDDNPLVAEANLEFLQNEIINRISLLGLSTEVRPGVIGMWKSALVYQETYWNGYVGIDLWFQTKEKHGCIHAPQELINTLDICKSFMPYAFQNKLIGGFGYTHYTKDCTLTGGIDGDVTLFTTGVGRNYMVTLRLDAQF